MQDRRRINNMLKYIPFKCLIIIKTINLNFKYEYRYIFAEIDYYSQGRIIYRTL